MFKKIRFYALLVIFPVIGSGIDLVRDELVKLNTGDFTLGRWILLYDVAAAILFAAVIVCLATRLEEMHMPKLIALGTILFGTLILFIPISYVSGFSPTSIFHIFFDSYQWHLVLAGAVELVLGVGSLFLLTPKKAT